MTPSSLSNYAAMNGQINVLNWLEQRGHQNVLDWLTRRGITLQ